MGTKKAGKSSGASAKKTAVKPLSFDSELDALFASASAAPPPPPILNPTPSSSAVANGSADDEEELKEEESKEEEEESDSDEEDEEAVEAEMSTMIDDKGDDELDEVVHEDSDSDDQSLVHETLRKGKKGTEKTKASRSKVIDNEPQEARDRRSIFVGNLPISLITDRPAIKQFKRHIVAQSPYPSVTRVQSIRFRSIPFAKPTDDYEARHPEEAESKMRKRRRSQAYKEGLGDDEGGSSEKRTYLSGAQKRKVAFITQQINDKADFVNAYVTLSQFDAAEMEKLRGEHGAEKAERLTPVVLAALLARSAHNTTFEGRHLRVDLVKSLTPQEIVNAGLDRVKTADGGMIGALAGGSGVDQEARRRTLFVGNMDFETREEEVRSFFDLLLTGERGQAPAAKVLNFSRCTLLPSPEASVDDDRSERSWVQDVRIIRDAATQMGKGFSYVRFLDSECVDEVLAIHESEEAVLSAAKAGKSTSLPKDFRRKLKLKGRPLRVSRCKAPKGNVTTVRTAAGITPGKPRGTPPAHRSRSTGAPTPGGTSPFAKRQRLNDGSSSGSPTRKQNGAVKAVANPPPRSADPLRAAEVARKKADPERQARRMAKKAAKRTEQKMQAVAKESGGTRGRVPLKVKPRSGGGGATDGGKNRKKHSSGGKSGKSAKVRAGKA